MIYITLWDKKAGRAYRFHFRYFTSVTELALWPFRWPSTLLSFYA